MVVVKEVEITKLVPFEPTPPGFGPMPGWSVGMPVDSAYTHIFTPPQKVTSKKVVWTRRKTTSLPQIVTTTIDPLNISR